MNRVSHPGYRALMIALFGPTGEPPTWRAHAACRSTDTGRFYDTDEIDEAKAVCAGCPVLAQCRTDQLRWEQHRATRRMYPIGVVAGLTATDRRNLHCPDNRKKVA